MSGGGGTTTSNTSTSIPPEVLAEYQNVTGQANQIASNPLQQYQGPVVAGLTPEENSAFNTIDNSQGTTAPYTASANNLIGQATQGINPDAVTSADIAQYQSPYTQQVLNTTMAAENNQDAQQQAQLQGNAISAGAWGGDRAGVAQGILGGQQAYANNATNAGILNQGYSQALSEANTQQQQNVAAQEATGQLDLSGGLAENQLGTSALSNTLAGANAQLSAGQVQQQQAQSELNVPYEQFLQQQAYPYQTTGWLANIAEGLGSNEGGTTTGTTTQPSQGLFKRGGGIGVRRDDGGSVDPSPQQGILSHIQQIPQRLRLQQAAQNSSYGTGNQAALLSGMARGGIVPHRDAGGTTIGGLDFSDWIAANPGATYNGAGEVVTSNGSGMGGYWAPDWAQNFDASGNYINPNAPVAAKPSAPAFTAQTAPAAATSAAPSTSGVSYTGGTVKGINPAGQADLDAIYGKKARGGIVAPKHFDAGGGDITPDDVVQASTGYTLPDGTSDSMQHDYSGTSMPPLPSQNISSDSEGLPPPTPPVNAQGHPDAVSATSATVPNYEKDLPSDHQANPWLSVAAGVLGTLAGRSRNPLIDIGQGGLIGLNNYAQQSEVADKQNYQEGSFHQNAQKLAQEAQEHINDAKVKQQNADSDTARTEETARHNQAAESNQAADLALRARQKYTPATVYVKDPTTGQLLPASSAFNQYTGDYGTPNTNIIPAGAGGKGGKGMPGMDLSASDPYVTDLSKKTEDIDPTKTLNNYYGVMGAINRNPQMNQYTPQQPGFENDIRQMVPGMGGIPTEDMKTIQTGTQQMQADMMKQQKNIRTQREFNTVTGPGVPTGGNQQNAYNNTTAMAAGALLNKAEPTFLKEYINKNGGNAQEASIAWDQYVKDNDPTIRDTNGNVKTKINASGQYTGLDESKLSPASWQKYLDPKIAQSIKAGTYQAPPSVKVPANATWSKQYNGWVVPNNGGYALWQP